LHIDVYRVLVGKPEEKIPLGKPRRRWENNIKMVLQEVGCRGMDWIEVSQNRDRWRALANAVMKFLVPSYAGNFRLAASRVAIQEGHCSME
jgi:hypothetical protein